MAHARWEVQVDAMEIFDLIRDIKDPEHEGARVVTTVHPVCFRTDVFLPSRRPDAGSTERPPIE